MQVVKADIERVRPAVDMYLRTTQLGATSEQYTEMLAFAAFVNRATPNGENFKTLFEDAARDIAAITASLGIPPEESGGAGPILHVIGTMLKRAWTRVMDRLPDEGVNVLVSGYEFKDPKQGRFHMIACYEDGAWFVPSGDRIHAPTHWQALYPSPLE
jgi:hypothetical protein